MTAVLKRFQKKTPAESRTPEEHELWVKHSRISERLELQRARPLSSRLQLPGLWSCIKATR